MRAPNLILDGQAGSRRRSDHAAPLILLKIIGKAALHASGVGELWSILVEEMPELANNVWDDRNAA